MGQSIFSNFDPEEWAGKEELTVNTKVRWLVIKAVASCHHVTFVNGRPEYTPLNNDGFRELAEGITNLSRLGFESRSTMGHLHCAPDETQFGDLPVTDWALHGLKGNWDWVRNEKISQPESGPTECQIYAMAALWTIDTALTNAINEGITLNFVNDIALAGTHLADANESAGFDEWLQLRAHLTPPAGDDCNEITLASARTRRAALSALGRLGADATHRENRAMKQSVLDWCALNMVNYTSMDSAAEAVAGKIVPITFRTARSWIGDWKKQIQSGGEL